MRIVKSRIREAEEVMDELELYLFYGQVFLKRFANRRVTRSEVNTYQEVETMVKNMLESKIRTELFLERAHDVLDSLRANVDINFV